MVPKPNYRMRKVRKTGLTTIELQRRFPDLYEATTKAQDEGTAPSTCSAVKNSGSVTICTVCVISDPGFNSHHPLFVPFVPFLSLGSTLTTHCLYHVCHFCLWVQLSPPTVCTICAISNSHHPLFVPSAISVSGFNSHHPLFVPSAISVYGFNSHHQLFVPCVISVPGFSFHHPMFVPCVPFLSLGSGPTTHCLYHLCHFCLGFNSRKV